MTTTPLETLIKKRIRRYGAISVADYMSMCLAHPEHGYYMRRDPLGASGDFTTSPEISQIYGELLGLWLAAQWQKQKKPRAILVECGPGRGTLMMDALRATKKIADFHDMVSVHLVETSPVLKQKQWKNLADKHPNITWHESIETLPELPIFFIANEFFDALPIEQQVDGETRKIGLDVHNHFTFLPLATHHSSLITESSSLSLAIMRSLAAHITTHGGAGLVVDYGYEDGSQGDTLQAVKHHQFHNVLSDAGEADITAHVDFDALKEVATKAGSAVFGALSQGKFLLQIGASQRLMSLCATASDAQKKDLMSGFERLISHEQMGELFKVLALLPHGSKKPEGF